MHLHSIQAVNFPFINTCIRDKPICFKNTNSILDYRNVPYLNSIKTVICVPSKRNYRLISLFTQEVDQSMVSNDDKI